MLCEPQFHRLDLRRNHPVRRVVYEEPQPGVVEKRDRSAGIVSHTPIGTFIDLESPPGSGGDEGNPSKFKALLDFANNLGDMIGGRARAS